MTKFVRAALLAVSWLTAVSGGFEAIQPASAKDAHVIRATATQTGANTWGFDVTVKSNDTGWNKHAARWQVLRSDDKVLGTRILHHSHETEQPFTRFLSKVKIPAEVTRVTIRARDKVKGYGGRTVTLTLKPRS